MSTRDLTGKLDFPISSWHVTACVGHPITQAQADRLFDAIAAAAHDWAPDGADVSGGPCHCRRGEAARPPDINACLLDDSYE
jgi:hypothetical protein